MTVEQASTTSDAAPQPWQPDGETFPFLAQLADQADLCLVVMDADDRVIYSNAGFSKLLGFDRHAARGQNLRSLLTGDDLPPRRRFGADVPKDVTFQERLFVRTRDGNQIWITATFRRVFDSDGRIRCTAGMLLDVTGNLIQAMQRQVLDAMVAGGSLEEIGNLICLRAEALAPDIISTIVRVDDKNLLHPLAAPSLPAVYANSIDGIAIGPSVGSCGTAAFHGEPVFSADIATDPLWASHRDIPLPPALRSCWSSPIRLANGRIAGTFAFYFRDGRGPSELHQRIVAACVHLCTLAIERHESELHIQRLAYFDDLTGLPNRTRLFEEIDRCLAQAEPAAQIVALLCVDIDHFKYINDTLGHLTGDLVLVEIARRLTDLTGPGNIIGRVAGDGFVIVLPGSNANCAAEMADDILQSLVQPITVEGASLPVSVSVGIAVHPWHGARTNELLKNADAALHEAKRLGRGTYRLFMPEMNKRGEDRVVLGAALQDSLAKGALHLHYQPQIRMADGAVCGVEALARWTHPELGTIPPDRFIPIAEECGLIEQLGAWALDEACRQLAAWRAQRIPVPAVSVNLSPLHFRNQNLPDLVAGALARYRLAPSMLTLEITEGVMMDDGPTATTMLRLIHALGVGLSMDDFGTGYSSLSGLATMPFSELKIDRSFINRLETDAGTLAIVTAVIRIGQSLGMTVVAEGVETAAQRDILRQLGCHVAQGYFVGRPMDAAAFAEWVHGQKLPLATSLSGAA
jgi:diguanylate cyclase (GGDEF)-like protein/PAS domain S-box-containing protein